MSILSTVIILLVISSVVQFLRDLAQRQRDNGGSFGPTRPINPSTKAPAQRPVARPEEIFSEVKPAEDFEEASLMERKKATQHWEGPRLEALPEEQVMLGADHPAPGTGILGNFPNGVARGIIWSEILQPPKAKRRRT